MKRILLLLLLCVANYSPAQWTEQVSGVNVILFSVSAVDDNVVWACGGSGTVIRTKNAGINWITTASPNVESDLYTIQGIDAASALVAGFDGFRTFAYKTIDSGATWTQVFSQIDGFVDAIKPYNGYPGKYALVGDPVDGRWTYFTSNDYGSTWDSTGLYKAAVQGDAGWNNSCFTAVPGLFYWHGTNSTKVIQGTSGGIFTDLPTPGLTDSYAIWGNDNNRLMTGGATDVLYSMDGGATWSSTGALGSGDVAGIIGGGSTWYYVRGTSAYKSFDNGTTWSPDYTAPSGIYFHMSLSPRGRCLWAVRTGGGISRYCFDFPLPVELSSFTSTIAGRNINLDWTTIEEFDNAGFDIERWRVAENSSPVWQKVGFVKGNGNTTEMKNYSFSDRGLATGTYQYRLKQTDYNGNYNYHYLSGEVVIGVPEKFALSQNYPNPFNPSTTINFDLPESGNIDLRVYDMTGKEIAVVVSEFRTAGYHSVNFNAANLSSGVYIYRLVSGSSVESKKMSLLK